MDQVDSTKDSRLLEVIPCSLIDSLSSSSEQKMETDASFIMLVFIYQTIQHSNISEDHNLNIHHCKNSVSDLQSFISCHMLHIFYSVTIQPSSNLKYSRKYAMAEQIQSSSTCSSSTVRGQNSGGKSGCKKKQKYSQHCY
jgi:hypothetical protein